MRTKVQRVMEHIRDNYESWMLDTDTIWRLCAECDCSPSTVRKAIRQLREMGCIHGGKYGGRWWVDPNAIVEAMKPLSIHSMFTFKDKHYDLFRRQFFANSNRVIYEAIDTAIRRGLIAPAASGHVYGWMLRILEAA